VKRRRPRGYWHSCAAIAFGLATACGGRVDESDTVTASSGCEGACEHLARCATSAESRASCVRNCETSHPDPTRAGIYGDCVRAIPCADVQRALYADYGPLGACHDRAERR